MLSLLNKNTLTYKRCLASKSKSVLQAQNILHNIIKRSFIIHLYGQVGRIALNKRTPKIVLHRNYPGHHIFSFINPKNALIPVRSLNIWKASYLKSFRDFTLNKQSPIIFIDSSRTNIPLLAPIFPKKNIVSGIMSLSPKERSLLMQDSLLADQFRERILINLAKILYDFLNVDSIEDSLDQGFKKAFYSVIINPKSSELYHLIDDKKEITLVQSLISYVWGYKTFDYTLLENFSAPHLNCISYKNSNIKMLPFIEAYIIKKALFLKRTSDFPYKKIYLINADNLIKEFSIVDSRLRVNQNHADLFILEHLNKLKLYFDVKSYTMNGVGHCSLSLFQGDIRTYQRELNNIVTSIHNFIKNEKSLHMIEIKNLYDNLKDIQKKGTKNVHQTFNIMFKIISEISINPNFHDLKLNIARDIPPDQDFIVFYKKILKPFIDKTKTNKEMFEELFPKDYMIDNIKHKKNIEYFIDNLFPKELGLKLKKNFNSIIYNIIENNVSN